MGLLIRATLLLGVAALTTPSVGFAQKADRLQFEVASVKPTGIDARTHAQAVRSGLRAVRVLGSTVEYKYMSLRQLVAEAYQVRPAQVVGADWMQRVRFDLICKMPAGSAKGDLPQMLQSLLTDRFKLVAHREPRTLEVMALVVDKNGHKLKESAPEPATAEGWDVELAAKSAAQKAEAKKSNRDSGAVIMGAFAVHFSIDNVNSLVHLEFSRMQMSDFADLLTRFPVASGRIVVDQTGLTGQYDAVLDVALSDLTGAMAAGDSAGYNPAELASTPSGGGMLRSLHNLGLGLEKRKASVEYIIVDQAERTPTEN